MTRKLVKPAEVPARVTPGLPAAAAAYGLPGGAAVRHCFWNARTVATFAVGEPVPDADYIRLRVSPGTSEADVELALEAARRRAVAEPKLAREPELRVAVPDARGPQKVDARALRRVVDDRLARAEGVGDRAALRAALEEVLTEAGL